MFFFLWSISFGHSDIQAGNTNTWPTEIDQAASGPTLTFYSRGSGSWSTPSTWSNTGNGGPAALTVPGAADLVYIGDGATYNHTITVTAGSAACGSLTLFHGSILDLGTTTGNNFGTVNSGSTGTIRISTNSSPAVFPAGNFSAFLGATGGTVEYYTTGSQNYTLPVSSAAPTSAPITNYCFLQLSPGNGREITMPNSNLNIYRNMTVSGGSPTTLVKLNNIALSALTIYGHLFVNTGELQFQNANNKALTMRVDSNVTVSSGAKFDLGITGPGADNTLSIGGSLINNGTFDMSFSQAQRAYPVIFTGNSNATISGTGPVTDFFAITVDKGNSQSSILNVTSSAFSFSNNTDPLILLNGTFRLTSSVTVTASENAFTIPVTARLSANGGIIQVTTNYSNLSDVILGGTIEVLAGGIVVGNAASNVNNDIAYAGTGFPTIDIQAGTLLVNGQIRRSSVDGSGSLIYNQTSGSSVTINGRNQLATRAKLEILNTGSVFNMSGGTLTFVRGGGTTFNDLFLNPSSSNVSGGTVIFGSGSTGASGQDNIFTLDVTPPLFNLTVDGTTNSKTLSITQHGLTLQGNLVINSTSILNANIQQFNIAGNWINSGTFNHNSGTVNFNGSSTISGNSTTTFNNLSIETGKSLTGKLDGNVNLQGNWTNNGIFNHNNGTLVFNGATQSLGGTSAALFNNMLISSGSTTNINQQGQTLRGILKSDGTLHANGNLTLISTADQTALIDGSGTGEVLGNTIIQRYLPAGFGYKYVCSPFQSATVGQLAGHVNLGAAFPTFYRYDENKITSGWVIYTNASGILTPGLAYASNFGPLLPDITFDLNGEVTNHTVTLSPLYNHNNQFTLGFNLIGNPYPSPIDWDAASGWTRVNIDNALYYFNAGSTDQYTGTYSTYINHISSDGIANNIIPSMQGCFVHISNGSYPVSGTIIFNNPVRVNNLSPSYHKSIEEDSCTLVRLVAGFQNEATPTDPTVIYFDNIGLPVFDKERDALKLMNTDVLVPNLYSVSADNQKLSINALPMISDSVTVIPLGLKTEKDGLVNIKLEDIQHWKNDVHLYLSDPTEGVLQDLQNKPEMNTYLKAGQYEGRFSLIISLKDLQYIPETGSVLHAYSSGKKLFFYLNLETGEKGDLEIYNMSGQAILKKEISGKGYHQCTLDGRTGIFIVRIRSSKEILSKRVFIGN